MLMDALWPHRASPAAFQAQVTKRWDFHYLAASNDLRIQWSKRRPQNRTIFRISARKRCSFPSTPGRKIKLSGSRERLRVGVAVMVLAKLARSNFVPFLSVLTGLEASGQGSKKGGNWPFMSGLCKAGDDQQQDLNLASAWMPQKLYTCVCVLTPVHAYISVRNGFWFSSAS